MGASWPVKLMRARLLRCVYPLEKGVGGGGGRGGGDGGDE